MNVGALKIVHSLKPPMEVGEHHRLIFMTGKNKGLAIYLGGDRHILGRGEKADIKILDTKSSREHAELKKVDGHYVITDLGSQNGLMINDLLISQHQLIDNDKIIIGATVLRYNYYNIEESRLQLVEIDEDDEYEEEEDNELEELKEFKPRKSLVSDSEAKRKKVIYGIVVIVLAVVLFLPTEETPSPQEKKSSNTKAEKNEDDFSIFIRSR